MRWLNHAVLFILYYFSYFLLLFYSLLLLWFNKWKGIIFCSKDSISKVETKILSSGLLCLFLFSNQLFLLSLIFMKDFYLALIRAIDFNRLVLFYDCNLVHNAVLCYCCWFVIELILCQVCLLCLKLVPELSNHVLLFNWYLIRLVFWYMLRSLSL